METTDMQTIIIDFRKNTMVPLPHYTQYHANKLKFIVKDNGVDADLSNIDKVIVSIRRADGVITQRSLQAEGNEITYDIGDEEQKVIGYAGLTLHFLKMENVLFSKRLNVYFGEPCDTERHDHSILQELFIEVREVENVVTEANGDACEKANGIDEVVSMMSEVDNKTNRQVNSAESIMAFNSISPDEDGHVIIDMDLSEFVTRQEVEEEKDAILSQITDQSVNVKEYGAIGDGVFRKIKDVNPSITLAEVKELDPDANLDNSIDWYGIQKAIQLNNSIKIQGSFIIDRPLMIDKYHFSMVGTSNFATITNIGIGLPAIILGKNRSKLIEGTKLFNLRVFGTTRENEMSGHGIEVRMAANVFMSNCDFIGHGGNGLFSGVNHDFYISRLVNCRFEMNKDNGVLIEHYYAYQKNNISFIGCRAQNNGRNEMGQLLYQLGQTTTTYGHGIKISGTAIFIGAGTCCEGNSGSGVYLGGDSPERLMIGIQISGCYFEPNLLTDIYIANNANIFDGFISGNYPGADYINKSQLGHQYIENLYNLSSNTFIDSFGGNKNLEDIKSSTSLFTGGEFDTKGTYNTNDTMYDKIFGDGIKLDKNKNSFLGNNVIFVPGLIKMQVDYYWNKVNTSSLLIGLYMKDYDSNPIWNKTLPDSKVSDYSELSRDVNESDTILYFDDLTGWSVAGGNTLVFYDTVLSNGYAVGVEYSNNYLSASSIASIDVANKRVYLNSPINKTISSGTVCALTNDTGTGAFLPPEYFNIITTSNSKLETNNLVIDTFKLRHAKFIRYVCPYIILNGAAHINDYVALRRVRIKEMDSLSQKGSTANRPSESLVVGKQYFDTTLNKPVWWNGTIWKDANGNTV
ncbi:right-handed parallel beta-helix repeat-containing protein [Bacillus sp. Hm123]|uniref:right-handed parallel beta-helix repeat-containing protein n=1 Tax=Bacillus sp. Hm123 TaxID=3450745 RepID=UPI003F43273A